MAPTSTRVLLHWVLLLVPLSAAAAPDVEHWVHLPGTGKFSTVLRYEEVVQAAAEPAAAAAGTVRVAPFELQRTPVSNAEFLAFVVRHPQWRRGVVATVFAEPRYLSHWSGPLSLGPQALPQQPVVQVSWFAAQAYCETLGARLPTWTEWEYAAAADATRADARADPAWRERILAWYSRPSSAPLAEVGQGQPDVHGLHDLNGLVWEWVEDYAAMLVSGDNREQGDADLLRFCGAGALSTNDRENYAVLMRIAMLSALEAADTTGNLGFRCARDPTTGVVP